MKIKPWGHPGLVLMNLFVLFVIIWQSGSWLAVPAAVVLPAAAICYQRWFNKHWRGR